MKSSLKRTSRLNYSGRRDTSVYAELVTENTKKVPILQFAPHGTLGSKPSKLSKLAQETVQGKTIGNQLVTLPAVLADVVSHHTWNVSPLKMRQNAAKYYLDLQAPDSDGHRPTETQLDVETHMTGIFLQNYASVFNVLNELKRRKPTWVPANLLEIGFGPSTGILAFNEVYKDENAHKKTTETDSQQTAEGQNEIQDLSRDSTNNAATNDILHKTKSTRVSTVMGHDSMVKRARAMLKAQGDTSTMVLNQLPGNENSRDLFDLIIAIHQLDTNLDKHMNEMMSLLAPGGVVVLIERGDPYGFETIARARQILVRPENNDGDVSMELRKFKSSNVRIVAPCAHQGKCPLQVGADTRSRGSNPGFFNWCHFAQMVQRPKFAQELKKGAALGQQWIEPGKGKGGKSLAGKGRPGGKNFETATHSYLIVEKEKEKEKNDKPQMAEITNNQPAARIMKPPLKRDKHVIMEVCSPSGDIQHWTVTQSFSKQAYHDARKATGGDLWGLGAKTIQERGGNKVKLERLAAKASGAKGSSSFIPKNKLGRVQSKLEEKAWNRQVKREKRSLDGEIENLGEFLGSMTGNPAEKQHRKESDTTREE